jgi:hypothetical protein
MDIPKTTEPPDPLPEGIPVSIIDANPYSIQVVDLKGYTNLLHDSHLLTMTADSAINLHHH